MTMGFDYCRSGNIISVLILVLDLDVSIWNLAFLVAVSYLPFFILKLWVLGTTPE